MAGKNHPERSIRLWFDDSGGTPRDLSGDLVPGSLSGGGIALDEVDLTGVSNSIRQYMSGHGDSEVTANFHMNDTATTGAFTVLSGQNGLGGTLTIQFGQNGAAPVTLDPEWEGEYILISTSISIDGNKPVINARFIPQAGAADPAWGTMA